MMPTWMRAGRAARHTSTGRSKGCKSAGVQPIGTRVDQAHRPGRGAAGTQARERWTRHTGQGGVD